MRTRAAGAVVVVLALGGVVQYVSNLPFGFPTAPPSGGGDVRDIGVGAKFGFAHDPWFLENVGIEDTYDKIRAPIAISSGNFNVVCGERRVNFRCGVDMIPGGKDCAWYPVVGMDMNEVPLVRCQRVFQHYYPGDVTNLGSWRLSGVFNLEAIFSFPNLNSRTFQGSKYELPSLAIDLSMRR